MSDNINLPEDYDEELEEDYSEINSFESAIQEMQQREERNVARTKPLKLKISKLGTWFSEEWDKLYPHWYHIANRMLTPNTIKSERNFCKQLLLEFGEGEYLVQTWWSKTQFDIQFKEFSQRRMKKKKDKRVHIFTFWKGEITREYFLRKSGNVLGYLRSALPLRSRHLWVKGFYNPNSEDSD